MNAKLKLLSDSCVKKDECTEKTPQSEWRSIYGVRAQARKPIYTDPFLVAVSLDVILSGSGNIDLVGSLENQDVTISGSGDYEGADLESLIAEVLISGSGSVNVRVEDQLDVLISGSGNVRYYGSPELDQSVTGSGSIRKLGE